MKVSHVTMFYLPMTGGQETYIENLNRVLRAQQIETAVVQPRHDVSGDHPSVRFLPAIKGIRRLIADANWFWFNLQLRFAKRYLEDSDLIICHYPFHLPPLAWHKKTLVLSHGVDWLVPPRTFADRHRAKTAIRCRKLNIPIVANDTHFFRTLGWDIPPRTKYFEQVGERAWFIPNCVDLEVFRPLGTRRERVILVPRNIRHVRGIHLAIEAFGLFGKEHPDYLMHIVGGPLAGAYYGHCRGLVEKLGLQSRVKFLGSVPWKELVTHYNAAELTLVPTLALEGTSLSALESMACGTPVVSTSVGGLADLPTEKADPTPKSVAEAMARIVNDWAGASERQFLSTTGTFNLKNWGDAWLRVIRAVAGF